MTAKDVKYELQNILQGKNTVSNGELIQTTANYLRKCTQTSKMAERNKPNKEEETKELIRYINSKK